MRVRWRPSIEKNEDEEDDEGATNLSILSLGLEDEDGVGSLFVVENWRSGGAFFQARLLRLSNEEALPEMREEERGLNAPEGLHPHDYPSEEDLVLRLCRNQPNCAEQFPTNRSNRPTRPGPAI